MVVGECVGLVDSGLRERSSFLFSGNEDDVVVGFFFRLFRLLRRQFLPFLFDPTTPKGIFSV